METWLNLSTIPAREYGHLKIWHWSQQPRLMVSTRACEGRPYSHTLRTGPCCKTHPTRQSRAPLHTLPVRRVPAFDKWCQNRLDNGCLRLRQMVIKTVRQRQGR